jgi:hypothetical protein
MQVEKWGALNSMKMTIMEAVEMLDDLVDESDPDVRSPSLTLSSPFDISIIIIMWKFRERKFAN